MISKVYAGGVKAVDGLNLDVEYDGTAWGAHLGNKDPVTDPTTLFDVVNKDLSEQFKIRFTEPFGFNNTYALAMPRVIAEEHNIKTHSDLAAHADKFVFGTTSEFMGRDVDGFNPLSDAYGFKFKDVKQMTDGLRYRAIEQKEIEVMDAYATDGTLKAFDMVILVDDKSFFPPYYGAPLVRMATLEKHPELEPLLNKLGNTLTDEIMQELNYRVAVGEEAVEAVATDWLRSMNLIN